MQSEQRSQREPVAPATAHEMATRQRAISVSEFFLKNRHLLGFDSPYKALLVAVKEAVDNALDACEEAGILPEILVEIREVASDVYRVVVEDNGPGIVEGQIGKIFGKLLYGSKFHKLSQSRGQQGIGISAAGMYAELTTGRPMRVVTKTSPRQKAWEVVLSIDTTKNRPDIQRRSRIEWERRHGTLVEFTLEGHYRSGAHSVDQYLRQTAIANPHVTIVFRAPNGNVTEYRRSTRELPRLPREIKPHPYGIELGRLIAMLKDTRQRTLLRFLTQELSRVGATTARAIIARADSGLSARSYPRRVAHRQAAALHRALGKTKVSTPSTDCIVPIGKTRLEASLEREVAADFHFAVSRPPAVYRGNPFLIEAAIAYGRPDAPEFEVGADGRIRQKLRAMPREELIQRADEPVRILRFANRVPLLFQQSACAMVKAVTSTSWKAYDVQQPKGSLPVGPMVIVLHIASVWVPFTSESKEAIAPYPEIVHEIELALRECGRALRAHLRRRRELSREYERRSEIEAVLPHIGSALQTLLSLGDSERDRSVASLSTTLHRVRSGAHLESRLSLAKRSAP